MAHNLCILLRKAPYGTINAAEALRHTAGMVSYGLDTALLLVGDGVYTAVNGATPEASPWASLSETLKTALKLAGSAGDKARILAHRGSLRERGIEEGSLISGVEVAEDEEVAQVLGEAEAVLVY